MYIRLLANRDFAGILFYKYHLHIFMSNLSTDDREE